MNITPYTIPSRNSVGLVPGLLAGVGAFGLGAAARWAFKSDADKAKAPDWEKKLFGYKQTPTPAAPTAPSAPVDATTATDKSGDNPDANANVNSNSSDSSVATGNIGSPQSAPGDAPDFSADQAPVSNEESGGGYDPSQQYADAWNSGEQNDQSLAGSSAEPAPMGNEDIPEPVNLAGE